MSNREIEKLEREIASLTARLNRLRNDAAPRPVPDYRFATLSGEFMLLDLFGGKQRLLAIHNMGQGCRYCTLWADGFNGMLAHLESAMSVVTKVNGHPSTATGHHRRRWMTAGRTSWGSGSDMMFPRLRCSAASTSCEGRASTNLPTSR